MPEDLMAQLALYGLVAIVGGRTGWDIVRSRSNGHRDHEWRRDLIKLMRDMRQEVSDLHNWHNQRDADGSFVWYIKRALDEAMTKLADNIEKQTEVLRAMHQEFTLRMELLTQKQSADRD